MKRTFKKTMAALLAAAMMICSAPLAGFVGFELPENFFGTKADAATYSGTCGDNLTWNLDTTTGELVISGTGAMKNYHFDFGFAPWYNNSGTIKSVTLPDGLTSIGDFAFYHCANLEYITPTPDNVTRIGSYAFNGCESLTNITIPDSVTYIGKNAFLNCNSLASITVGENNTLVSSDEQGVLFNKDKTKLIKYPAGIIGESYVIPDSVTEICEQAFMHASSLKNITIPDSVTSIGAQAFNSCSSLSSITIPNTVTTIGYNAFDSCSSLTSIIIPDSVTNLGDGIFSNCSSLTSVTMPNGIPNIGWQMFYECSSLANVTIPGSVTKIEGSAFYGCPKLTNIYYTGDLADWCNMEFSDSYSYPTYADNFYINGILLEGDVVIPDGVTRINHHAFFAYCNITSITIPNSVTSIGESAFSNCINLKSITLPDSITSISHGTFYRCLSLANIIIPNSVTSIDNYAFGSCSSLTSITIPDSVTSIDDYAFSYCPSLTSITLSDSITSIGYYTFDDCSSLLSAYYPGTPEQWKNVSVESGNSDLTGNLIFECNSEKPYYAFGTCGDNLNWKLYADGMLVISSTGTTNDCYMNSSPWYSKKANIKSVAIKNGVKNISDWAFSYCENLTNITIPESLTSIGNYAFSDCTGLTNIEIPDSVTSIGNSAFINCNGLTSITVNENNLYYSSDEHGVLFNKDKTNLIFYPAASPQNAYIIPNNVTSIDQTSFGACKNLTSITIPDGVTSLSSGIFSNCTSLKEVTMPVSFEYYGNKHFPTTVEKYILTKGNGKMQNFSYDNPPDDSSYLQLYGYLPWTNQNVTEVIICDGVTNIGSYAFYGSKAKITLPDTITEIGYSAFGQNLKSIVIPSSVKEIAEKAFYSCTNLFEVYYKGTIEQWKQMNIGKDNENLIKHVIIDYQSDKACYGAGDCGENLSWILYTDGKLEISGTGKMENWASLSEVPWDSRRSEIKKISVQGEVTSIGSYAFCNCQNLEEVTVPGYSVDIADSAFSNSPNVVLYCKSGSSVQSYAELNNVMYVLIDGPTADFAVKNNQLVNYKGNSANPKIPSGVTSIGTNAFKGNDTVKTLELPASVTSIFSGAFSDCSALEEIFIPHTVTTIAADAFSGTNAKIVCYANSTAHQFAIDNSIEFELVKVILNETALVLKVGEYSIITATPEQEYINSAEMSWKSSNTSIATVDENGKITAQSNGKVTISAIAPNGVTLATCSVNVIPAEAVKADVVNKPTQTTISYGDAIILRVDAAKIPTDGHVEWTASNSNFDFDVSSDGMACEITPSSSGDTTFTATVYDANGNAVSKDEQTMTSKAGFFDKIIAFFKKLFGLTKTYENVFKGII